MKIIILKRKVGCCVDINIANPDFNDRLPEADLIFQDVVNWFYILFQLQYMIYSG